MHNAPGTSTVKALSLRHALLIITIVVFTLFAGRSAQANYASLLMDASNGQVLYEANADLPRYPASLTKMMTLYMVFEALNDGRLTLGQPLYTSTHASIQSPTKLGLRPGQQISVEDAILALVTKSANDAAAVVAEALGGSEEYFGWQMTAKAQQLGMSNTTFTNASGLPDRRQITTARDMAILALALLHDFPNYYQYFATERFYWGGAAHANHNRLLGAYPGVDGIKTGYTHASGFNLVASAQRDGRRLIGVVMGARSAGSRSAMMTSLLDQAFLGPQIYLAQDQNEGTQTPASGVASALAALSPVATAVAAEPGSTRINNPHWAPARQEVRSARSARSSKVAARSKAAKQLAARSSVKSKSAASRRTVRAPTVAASRASVKGKRGVQLVAAQKTQRPQGPARVKASSPAKRKAVIAAAPAKPTIARPAKVTKPAAGSSKRRVADNERGSRS